MYPSYRSTTKLASIPHSDIDKANSLSHPLPARSIPTFPRKNTDGPAPTYSSVSLPHHSAQVYKTQVLASQPVARPHQTRGESPQRSYSTRLHQFLGFMISISQEMRALDVIFEWGLSPVISTRRVTRQAPYPTRLRLESGSHEPEQLACRKDLS